MGIHMNFFLIFESLSGFKFTIKFLFEHHLSLVLCLRIGPVASFFDAWILTSFITTNHWKIKLSALQPMPIMTSFCLCHSKVINLGFKAQDCQDYTGVWELSGSSSIVPQVGKLRAQIEQLGCWHTGVTGRAKTQIKFISLKCILPVLFSFISAASHASVFEISLC